MQRFRVASPRDVALAMLDARFGAAEPGEQLAGLATFQQDAVARVRSLLRRRHGAILADSVGLGKTHIAAALIRETVTAGGRVLVCGPPVLHAHWRRHLRRVRSWQWCSHASLSRGTAPNAPNGGWTLIVVDEAHAFRNPQTQRYRALARIRANADVLLLSATPVNNSLLDCYHLIRLFADDRAFHDIGVPDLRAAFEAAAHSSAAQDVRRVAEAVLVRRTRAFIARNYHAETERALRFPTAAPVRSLHYDTDGAYGDVTALLHDIMSLRFPAHMQVGGAAPTALLRLGLLKRLESSAAAFRASLQRHLALLNAADRAMARGFVLDAREFQSLIAANGTGAAQLLLDAAVLRPLPSNWNAARAREHIAAEVVVLRRLLEQCASAAGDPKTARLRELLQGELAGERVLIFTEFRETAIALWKSLRDEFRTALIHGANAFLGASRASRRAVLERFAPQANGVRAPPSRERVDVLIATDVLAEGLNLQDARVVVSYDVPWNPVRLAQRIGRIDRLGSPHERIEAIAFVPDQRVDALLGLVRRLRRKLRAIRLVGGDAPVFATTTMVERARGEVEDIHHTDAAASPGNHSQHALGRPATSAPRGALTPATFAADRPEWEIVEALRLEHRSARADGTAMTSGEALVASLAWQETRAAVLCCVVTGSGVRLQLVELHGTVRDDDPAIDRMLLQALRRHETAAPVDPRRVQRAAHAALHDVAPPTPTTNERPQRRAAALVHRWLNTRPLGPTDADYARADRLLAGLHSADGAAVRVHSDTGTLDARIDQLEMLVKSSPASAVQVDAGSRLVAALELTPSASVIPREVAAAHGALPRRRKSSALNLLDEQP